MNEKNLVQNDERSPEELREMGKKEVYEVGKRGVETNE